MPSKIEAVGIAGAIIFLSGVAIISIPAAMIIGGACVFAFAIFLKKSGHE